jgi:5-methylcytosine-specific restriction endonuclease McrA
VKTDKKLNNIEAKRKTAIAGLVKCGVQIKPTASYLEVIEAGYKKYSRKVPEESRDYNPVMARLNVVIRWTHNAKKKPKKRHASVTGTDFLASFAWRKLRMKALEMNDGRCECCGRSKHDGAVMHVDHIKPRKTHPELALTLKNLQVLCDICNHGKGNWSERDWREPSLAKLMGEAT